MRWTAAASFALLLAGCSAGAAPEAATSSSSVTSCEPTAVAGVTVFTDDEHQTVHYLPTRFAVQAIWYAVEPASDDDFKGCPSNATGKSRFCAMQSAVRYRLAPAPLTDEETAAITKHFGAGVTIAPMDFTIDPATSRAVFATLPDYTVFGASGSGEPDVAANGTTLTVTGWVHGGPPLSLLRTLQHQHQSIVRLTVGAKISCGASSPLDVRSIDWSSAPAEKVLDTGGVALDWIAGISAFVQRPEEKPSVGSIPYEIAHWSEYEKAGLVAPTSASHVALAQAIFPAMQTVLDGFGTPAIGSAELTKTSEAIDAALATFLAAYLEANGVHGADPAAVLDDLLHASDDKDAAAAARLPACLSTGGMFADALVSVHREARYLKQDASFVDGWNGAL